MVFTIRNQVLQSETHYFAIWMLYRYRQATLFLFLLGFILVIVLFPLGIQFKNNFICFLFVYLFTAALGLRCCTLAFSSCGERGLLQCKGFSLQWLLLLL